MKKAFKYIPSFAAFLLLLLTSAAQELPLMPADPAVQTGSLPNGMSYYLVTNPTTDGTADFALVQRTGTSDAGELALDAAKDALTSLPRLRNISTQSFLASHGVAPGKDGFVKVSENATLYHFDNVLLAEDAIDSVLLVIMDIADRITANSGPEWKLYAPADQAVVVSGDIDAASIASKLKMLSYMTPFVEPQERETTEWRDKDSAEFRITRDATGDFVTISASWTSARTPKQYMNTVQPVIYSMFMNELGLLAKDRLYQMLQYQNIPVASVSYDHVSSVRSFGDESFTVRLTVSPEHQAQAVEALARTMSSLDKGTAAAHELAAVKRRYLSQLEKSAGRLIKSNTEYVEQCAFAFLYNAPLTTAVDVYKFLKYRDLSVEAELNLFNNIAAALLDGQKNLTVACAAPVGFDISEGDLRSQFSAAWSADYEPFICKAPIDSMPLPPAGLPLKLKSTKRDPVSGGTVWTFANGFKVVYRRQETGRRMHYALALNGGYGNIKVLTEGEGAYVADYLRLNRVSGMSAGELRLALEEKGIEHKIEVNLSNTVILGSAHEADMDLLMRLLLASVNEREYDQAAFEYYKSCLEVEKEFVKGSIQERVIEIEKMMCPGYEYSSHKYSGQLSDDFQTKVEEFWKYQAGKTNDGVLVLVGNIEETKLRKLIQNYIGGFAVTDRAYPRTNVAYQPISGSVTHNMKGDGNSIDMVLSARQPLTVENYMASEIAAGVLKQMISEAISGTGMYLRLAHNCRIYPQERFNVMISVVEADPDGFARDAQMSGIDDVTKILRNVLEELPETEISEDVVQKYKTVLKGHLALKMKDPHYWVQAIVKRHLDGKDFTTSYESKIDAVTPAKVKAVLAPLSNTSRVEYIIER